MFDCYGQMLHEGVMSKNSEYKVFNSICFASGSRKQNYENENRKIVRESYRLYLVTKGKGIVTVDGIGFIVTAGQSFLTFPFSFVSLEADTEQPWEYKWIEFSGLEFARMVDRTSMRKKQPVVDRLPIQNIEEMFDIAECGADSSYAQCRAMGKLTVLLSYYIEYYPCRNPEKPNYAIVARNYIEKNYRNPDFSVQSVANHIKIDRTYLYRLFKEETGMSVIDYINHCRISKAGVLLMDGNIPIKDVAYSVGFTDQMYFSRVFKKIKGQTPSEYRKENKGKYII